MKKIITVNLEEEEIEMATKDAPRGNRSAYIGGLIRNNHLMARIPKICIIKDGDKVVIDPKYLEDSVEKEVERRR